jgi:NTE family protein
MKTGLVLGAGGLVGLAYHAGALRALEVEGGVVPDDTDVLVGTSAGSVIAAYLRTGRSTEDFWLLALGTHPELSALVGPEAVEGVFSPLATSPVDMVRRGIGSGYVLARSLVRVPVPPLPSWLARAFPGGFFAMAEGRRRFADELPEEWPDKELDICAVNITTGKRVVLGRRKEPALDLRQAVLASAAIPGLYPPVRIGPMTLVDGGAHSTTNLDVAVRSGCQTIFGVVPMAYDPDDAPDRIHQLIRRVPCRMLSREVAAARRAGVEVLLIRPSAAEVRLHGTNMMRTEGLDEVARAAYESTARTLATPRFQRALAGRSAA